MRPFIALIILHFKMLILSIVGFGGKRKKSKTVSFVFVSIIAAAIMLLISVSYSFSLAYLFYAAGSIELIVVTMALLTLVLCCFLTTFGSQGVLFGGKDVDILLSLPVSTFQLLLAKILALYLENVFSTVFLLGPAIFVYFYYIGFSFIPFIILASYIFILPFMSLVLTVIVGFIVSMFSGLGKYKNLIVSVLSLALFGAYFVFSFFLNTVIEKLLTAPHVIMDAFARYFPPLVWMRDAFVEQDFLSFLLFTASAIIPFLIVVYVLSIFYRRIVTKSLSHRSTSNYKMKSLTASSAFMALFKKEIKKFFGTPMYLLNSGIGAFMLCLLSVAMPFFRAEMLEILALIPEISPYIPAGIALIAISTTTMCIITAVSISLEGDRLWILKEAPVAPLSIFVAKVSTQLAVTIIPILLLFVSSIITFSLSLFSLIPALFLCLSFCCFFALFGITVNLLVPKLDFSNETIVIKQSASTSIVLFGNMIIVAAITALYFFFFTFIPFNTFFMCVGIIFSAISALLLLFLKNKGPDIFLRL